MSSAILYLAIVAIWAVVLVPRWLRRPHATPQAGLPEERIEPGSQEETAVAAGGVAARAAAEASQARAGAPAVPPAQEPRPGSAEQGSPPEPIPASLTPARRRARILRARRRTLFTLILLTAGAVALTIAHLAAWWVSLPPGVMLAGFLPLLRAAARIDAERAAARAAQARDAADTAPPARERRGGHEALAGEGTEVAPAATGSAGAAAPATAPDSGPQPAPRRTAEPDAEIIDISARIGDQLYDQYDDAEARAIGD